MKSSHLLGNFGCISSVTLLAVAAVAAMAPAGVRAATFDGLPSSPSWGANTPPTPAEVQHGQPSQQVKPMREKQQMFATPDAAAKALRAAVDDNDAAALAQIFGPLYESMQTGDKVQDANNRYRFAHAMDKGYTLDQQSDHEVVINVGTNGWPMPIPLVKTNAQWYFDTAAGRDEIINRHIGKDELTAIGVCRDYGNAQREFARMNNALYAKKFNSTPGTQDGLYWPTKAGEQPSPFDELVAQAYMEGYGGHHGTGLHAYHGYHFKILTEQGEAAPGGRKDYLSHDKLKDGFALVAYPEVWGQSGMMTFMVNQDGKVYQQDLGQKTDRIASRMKAYNPDQDWALVQDAGIPYMASSK
jgi:Protein of unknown function (DUF2950)